MNLKEALVAFSTGPEDVEEGGPNRGIRRPDWSSDLYVVPSGYSEPDMLHDRGRCIRSYYPTLNDIVADDWEVVR
jgi:hypothetical protein